PKKSPRKAQEKPKKSPRKAQEEILLLIKSNPQITRKELAESLGRTEGSIRYYLRQLIQQGMIKHVGATKSGEWIIL
ncbi:MAG TPA: winged helix-turn-helix transcriptional regulator, partial [Bacteroidales bacterium]|nr:winged helix-turn-helix transcriptional regulator [Bacteroidales bacterium]